MRGGGGRGAPIILLPEKAICSSLFFLLHYFVSEVVNPYIDFSLCTCMDFGVVHPYIVIVKVVVIVQSCLHLKYLAPHASSEFTFPHNVIVGETLVFYKKFFIVHN